jgi:hypothetical protein
MAHLSTLTAALFTSLVVTDNASTAPKSLGDISAVANCQSNFSGTEAAGAFLRIKNVKEFPAIGTPANIVKVPVYGQKTSSQINGQADLNNMELTINFIPGDWSNNKLGTSTNITIGDGVLRVFRFTLADKDPQSVAGGGYSDTAGSLGAVQNSSYYFLGKVEALEVTPSLTDALAAKLTISIQSEIKGAYTI